MKQALLIFFTALNCSAKDRFFIYYYNHPVLKKVGVYADDKFLGLTKAAKVCYHDLNGRYETEEKALEVIDVCANPYKILEK